MTVLERGRFQIHRVQAEWHLQTLPQQTLFDWSGTDTEVEDDERPRAPAGLGRGPATLSGPGFQPGQQLGADPFDPLPAGDGGGVFELRLVEVISEAVAATVVDG